MIYIDCGKFKFVNFVYLWKNIESEGMRKFNSHKFIGTLEGNNGVSILNLMINNGVIGNDYKELGLIETLGRKKDNKVIQNIGIIHAHVSITATASEDNMGFLVGMSFFSGSGTTEKNEEASGTMEIVKKNQLNDVLMEPMIIP